jgi:hypothetical protein
MRRSVGRSSPPRRWGLAFGLLLTLSAFATWSAAQTPTEPPPPVKETDPGLLTRDQVQKMIDKALADKASKDREKADQQKKQAGSDWVEVANNPKLEASWDNSLFFTSPNRDWRVHLGGRMQFSPKP